MSVEQLELIFKINKLTPESLKPDHMCYKPSTSECFFNHKNHLRRNRALPTHFMGCWVEDGSSTQDTLWLAAVSRLDHTYSCTSAKSWRSNIFAKCHLKNAVVLPSIHTAAAVTSMDLCLSVTSVSAGGARLHPRLQCAVLSWDSR